MDHAKILGVAVATMAMMAFAASSASATALYNGSTKLGVGSTLDFSNLGDVKLKNTAETETSMVCTGSTIKASVSNAGGTNVAVITAISEMTWTGCTVPTTSIINGGGLEIGQIGTSTEGTIKASGEMGISYNSIFFGICNYGVKKGSHLGKLVTTSSGTARFMVRAVTVKLAGSNFVCPEDTKYLAEYQSTAPDNLRVEAH